MRNVTIRFTIHHDAEDDLPFLEALAEALRLYVLNPDEQWRVLVDSAVSQPLSEHPGSSSHTTTDASCESKTPSDRSPFTER